MNGESDEDGSNKLTRAQRLNQKKTVKEGPAYCRARVALDWE